jgi:hypothetical protein
MIYILQLENNKYYVGWTARRNGGSEWTKKHKPVEVLKWINGTKQDEDRITLELMEELGWYNVRGGKWCKVIMTTPPKELNTISPKIQSVVNKVTKNSSYKQTKKLSTIQTPPIDTTWQCSYCTKTFNTHKGALFHENVHCKNNNIKKYNSNVYNSNIYNNNYDSDNSDNDNSDNDNSDNDNSDNDNSDNDNSDNDNSDSDGNYHYNKSKKKTPIKCYSCGRNGHMSTNCYASTHVKGYYI